MYKTHRNIENEITFKGLKSQYIWYLALGVGILLCLFALLYYIELSLHFLMPLIFALGTGLNLKIYQLSKKFGRNGLMKALAHKRVPKVIKCHSRTVFY